MGFLLVISACANPPQQIPQEITPVVTKFVYADGTSRYEYSSLRTTDQEVAGRATRTQNALRFHLSTTIEQQMENRTVRFSIDSIIEATGPGYAQRSRRALTGVTLNGTLNPNGAVTDLPDEGERSTLRANVTAAIKEFLPLIPIDGVEPGIEWIDTTSVTTDDGSTRITKNSIVYSTAGEWMLDERSTLPITWRAEYTLQGNGQQMGQNFTLTGSGLATGGHLLSADGFFLGMSSRDSSTAEVVLPTLGINVPIVQVGVDSVRIIP